MLSTRVLFGLSMVAALLFALRVDERFAPWFPAWFLVAGFGMLAAAREMTTLFSETSVAPSPSSVLGGVLAILISNWVPHVIAEPPQGDRQPAIGYDLAEPLNVLAWPFLTFIAVLMITFIVQGVQYDKPGRTMARIAGTMLIVAYVGALGSFTVQMRWIPGYSQGLMALVYLVATAKGGDTGAYTFGRIAGRHKLWPSLSPNKTIEGAIGGLAFGVLASVIVASIAKFALHIPTFSWGVVIVFGLIVGAVAQIGDLMESMIKRDCGRKDASRAVPGFGGVLDVIDSVLFAGPVAYAFWLFFGA